MKFAIALFSPPHAPSSRRALRFAEAVLAGGHEIVRLFLYQDAVQHASAALVLPQDETDGARQWQTFISDNQLDAVVCIAAALRRGVLNDEEAARHDKPATVQSRAWTLSGLGQLHEANQLADRLICFGGP
ncbi:sulfurtransferase complex subunit TusD [Pseudomonas mangrovi]|uniref:Sulfurtransferase complex subunit TusD n=1 Tax=Pseudomonas mangrovi TaxID=2161748 RepID=A0A2T5P7R9_9PSED|nr:sulfurtransferase complex subunit TusD [Pseudomonas mangrovi]PTU73799.1 sulfurtransferase complex subunit TusD [Pseudomonas mangrovi]